jgi:hypothetical protein
LLSRASELQPGVQDDAVVVDSRMSRQEILLRRVSECVFEFVGVVECQHSVGMNNQFSVSIHRMKCSVATSPDSKSAHDL